MIEYTVKVYPEGDKWWLLNDRLHREDGPAVELVNGTKEWHLNGKRHREDGPAFEGGEERRWYLDGKQLTEAEFNNRVNKSFSGKVVEIYGVKYKLVEVV